MIAMAPVLSTSPLSAWCCLPRRAVLLTALAAAGCTAMGAPPGPRIGLPEMTEDAFVMPDGARLPLRVWLPEGKPEAVILALHGFNDSRDAWEIPAPDFVARGIALYAPDQRGFGAAPGRGLWPGGDALVADAAEMARLVQARHPGAKLVLMGESMGGAVLMRLATSPLAPANVAGWVLVAPAVWGRARMNFILRGALWLAANTVPGLEIPGGGPVRVKASSNLEALIRLSRDPLTIRRTRVDTLRGLVDLMDAALAASPRFTGRGLFQYGAHDELVPPAATAATWRALPAEAPAGPRRAFYPQGWHLLLRDLERKVPIQDIVAWIVDARAPLPSRADAAARSWLASRA
jgi:acylglycerol lipase